MSSSTTFRTCTGAAFASALLLAACGSTGSSSSSGGGLYGDAPAGSATAPTGGSSNSGSSGGSSASGRYGNPPARSSASGPAAGGAVTTASSRFGRILVTPQRMTMYAFAKDTRGQSHCTGSCATYWPPVPAADAPPHPVTGVTATFGSASRPDGARQLTVDGFPVYT